MNGKQNEFWKLVEPEHNKALAFCRKLIGNRDDGDDLYQDSLVAALVKFDQLRDETSFKPWLYRIIVNRFKNRIRSNWWKNITSLTKEIETSLPGKNPSAVYTARRRLESAFKALNADDRVLVTLFELDGWSISELANLFDKKENAIKVRLSRSRVKMRNALIKKFDSSTRQRTYNAFETEDEICIASKPGKN